MNEIIDQLADMYVIPSGIVLGDDKVSELRYAQEQEEHTRMQEQQMISTMQAGVRAMPQVAGAMKDLSETQMPEGGTGLDILSGAVKGM